MTIIIKLITNDIDHQSPSQYVLIILCRFNAVRVVPCRADIKLVDLKEYLTISESIEEKGDIYAKVTHLKRPFSEFENNFALHPQ